MQSTIAGASDGGNLTPPINNGSGADSQRTAGFAQPKALQLGGNKPNAKAVAAQLAEQVAAEENGHATWTNNDLMDVNADEGDWSKSLHLLKRVLFSLVSSFFPGAFESAPAGVVSRFTSGADLGFGASRPGSPKGTSMYVLVRHHALTDLGI